MSGSNSQGGPALIWCPFPDADSAAAAAATLLDERLIACANILPAMRSLYCWQGERGDTLESAAMLKTDAALLEAALPRLAALHPYDEPAILAWRCDAAAPATAEWLGSLVG